MAQASLFVLDLPLEVYEANTQPMLSHINVGYGEDVTIRELAELVARVTGFTGEIVFDASKPDGTMRKLMDLSRLEAMGWQPSVARTGRGRNLPVVSRQCRAGAIGCSCLMIRSPR
jgi:nucleoside-diphosphate-sugar epimerase